MGEFQNGLMAEHFNESLAHNSTLSLAKVITKVKCYIKGEESNAEKKTHDFKERVPSADGSHHYRKSNYTSPIKYKTTFKRVGKET